MALVTLLSLAALAAGCRCSLVNRMDHDLLIANGGNFDSLVISPRINTPTSAFFYRSGDKNIKNLINYTLDIVAKDLKGVYPIYTVDCDQPSNAKICKSHLNDAATPQLIVYPILPQPQYIYKGKLDDKKQITGTLLSHIPSNVEIIPSGGFPLFMSNMEVVPKVLLVTDKEKPSWIYKALSNSFKKSLIFGFFKSKEHSDIVSRYNIKKFPWVAVIKNNKPQVYSGEIKFQPMFDWLNIFSETYIKGNEDSALDDASANPKPWKFEKVPEMTRNSHQDICFRDTSKGLCVIFLANGQIRDADKNMLIEISDLFSSKIQGRGASFRWMWLDCAAQAQFKGVFNVSRLPSLVVLNPHKRLRYVSLEGEADRKNIINLVEKVQVGDARFTIISGGKLPDFDSKDEL